MGCIFCDILQGKSQAHAVYEDKKHLAFLDKYPIDHGHTLVITRTHYERITDMNATSVGDLFSQVPKIARAVLKATGATAFSLGQNNGREANQIIPHIHIHIIPRYKDKGTVWTKRNIAQKKELAELADKIKSNM